MKLYVAQRKQKIQNVKKWFQSTLILAKSKTIKEQEWELQVLDMSTIFWKAATLITHIKGPTQFMNDGYDIYQENGRLLLKLSENCPQMRIKVRPTVLGWVKVWGSGLCLGLTLTSDLPRRAMVITHTHAKIKVKGQLLWKIRVVDWVETDGRDNVVGNKPALDLPVTWFFKRYVQFQYVKVFLDLVISIQQLSFASVYNF